MDDLSVRCERIIEGAGGEQIGAVFGMFTNGRFFQQVRSDAVESLRMRFVEHDQAASLLAELCDRPDDAFRVGVDGQVTWL